MFPMFIYRHFHFTLELKKLKVKIAPVLNQASHHEDVLGSGDMDPRILIGTTWSWVISFTARPLLRRYPLDRRLGGTQNPCGRDGEKKNIPFFLLTGIEPWSPSP